MIKISSFALFSIKMNLSKHSLRAIEKYAPWVNHIYVVTNGERPSWLLEGSKLTQISHSQIFRYKTALPTFNSNAIEMNLHRIPK